MNHKEDLIAGRNAVIEALRAKKPIDKIFVLDGCQDGPIRTIVREAKKTDAILKFVDKERLNQLTNEHHQGVVAIVAAYEYGTIDDLFKRAEEKGEDPFFILLDGIEDPHNLGSDESIIQFIEQYEALGYLPEALFNFIALLGWSPKGEDELFSREEFIKIFDPERL